MDRYKRPETLRECITDAELQGRADLVWAQAPRALVGATPPGGSDSGPSHAESVGFGILKLLTGANRLSEYSQHELFFLSVAAACHDTGKGVGTASDTPRPHGQRSSEWVYQSQNALGLERGEAEVVSAVIGVHHLRGQPLKEAIQKLDQPTQTHLYPIHPRKLAALLKCADALDAAARDDPLRVSRDDLRRAAEEAALAPAQDATAEAAREQKRREYEKTVFRQAVLGWDADRRTITMSAAAESAEDEQIVNAQFEELSRDELEPLAEALQEAGLPAQWRLDLQRPEPLLVTDAEASLLEPEAKPPAIVERWGPEPMGVGAGPPITIVPGCDLVRQSARTARGGPDDVLCASDASRLVVNGGVSGYWFLSSITDPTWLSALQTPLCSLARGADERALRALVAGLLRVVRDAPQVVADSPVLASLWESPSPLAWGYCIQVLREVHGFESALGMRVLAEAPCRGEQCVSFAATTLFREVEERALSVPDALAWFVRWLHADVRAGPSVGMPVLVELDWCVAELVRRYPKAALPFAAEIVENDRPDTGLSLEYQLACEPGGLADVERQPAVLARNLLLKALAEPVTHDEHVHAAAQLEQLLDSDLPHARIAAMYVLSHVPVACLDRARAVLADPATFDTAGPSHVRIIAGHLISSAFPLMECQDRDACEEVLLNLPQELTPDLPSAFRLSFLSDIPLNLRSERVRDEIARLGSLSRGASQDEGAPREYPFQRAVFQLVPPTATKDDFAPLLSDPTRLVAAIREREQDNPDGRYPPWEAAGALRLTLEEQPLYLLAVASALRAAQLAFPDTWLQAVGAAARNAGAVTGAEIVEIALALQDAAGSSTRRELAHGIADKWDTVAAAQTAKAVRLLALWGTVDPDPAPGPAPAESGRDRLHQVLDRAINSTRGIIAGCLVQIAGHATAADPAFCALESMAEDKAACVRAMLLADARHLMRDHYEWVVGFVQRLVADRDADVLAVADLSLRFLRADEVSSFGAPLAREMSRSDDAAVARSGGVLAAIWELRYAGADAEDLARRLADEGQLKARKAMAEVFAHNVNSDDAQVARRAVRQVARMLRDPEAAVRTAALGPLLQADDSHLPEDLLTSVSAAYARATEAEIDAMGGLVYAAARSPRLVAAVVGGALQSPSVTELLIGRYGPWLRQLYEVLSGSDQPEHRQLALRLLEAMCWHCHPAAGDLVAHLGESDPGTATGE